MAAREDLDALLRPMFEAIHQYQDSLVREVRQAARRQAFNQAIAELLVSGLDHSNPFFSRYLDTLQRLREAIEETGAQS